MTLLNAPYRDFRCRVAAVAEIFHLYGDFISNTIRDNVQDENQAEDLVQALFISLVHNPVPECTQSVKGYLYKVIINDIADADRRKRTDRCSIRIYAELSGYPAEQTSPPDFLIQAEQTRKALELIEHRLPPSEAKAITLRYRKQHSVKEAAEKMGVDRKTLRGYVYQGLSRIRRLLRNIEMEWMG